MSFDVIRFTATISNETLKGKILITLVTNDIKNQNCNTMLPSIVCINNYINICKDINVSRYQIFCTLVYNSHVHTTKSSIHSYTLVTNKC